MSTVSTGLLQCVAVRHLWRSNSMATVSTERRGTARHWCSPTWSYHSGAETAPLVTCETENRLKLAVLVYKPLHGLAPPYLSDDCQLVTDVGRRHLRSSDVYTCVVPRTQSQIGDRSFSVAGPRLWNNLPTQIRRRGTTFGHYRRSLKAFLFV